MPLQSLPYRYGQTLNANGMIHQPPARRPIRFSRALSLGLLIFTVAAAQSGHPWQPYILVGESGRNLARTSRDLVQRLFLHNYRLLGRYHPGGDISREVLVVTHPALLAAAGIGPPAGLLAAVCRIALESKGGLTYIRMQNLPYWGQAWYGDHYPAVATALEAFQRSLLAAMPPMRGQFNRYYGGAARPLEPAQLRTYQYRRRSEGLGDWRVLARFGSQADAVESTEQALGQAEGIAKVFSLSAPDGTAQLFGFALSGDPDDGEILTLLDDEQLRHVPSLPYELLIHDGQVMVLPLRYRLPLGSPGMDRRTFRRLKKLQDRWFEKLDTLFAGAGGH